MIHIDYLDDDDDDDKNNDTISRSIWCDTYNDDNKKDNNNIYNSLDHKNVIVIMKIMRMINMKQTIWIPITIYMMQGNIWQ